MLAESEVALLVLLSSACVQQKSDAKLKHVILFDRPACLLDPCEFSVVAKFLEQAPPRLYQTHSFV